MGELLWVSSSNQVSNFSRTALASSTFDIFTWATKQPNGVVLELQTTMFKLDVWLNNYFPSKEFI